MIETTINTSEVWNVPARGNVVVGTTVAVADAVEIVDVGVNDVIVDVGVLFDTVPPFCCDDGVGVVREVPVVEVGVRESAPVTTGEACDTTAVGRVRCVGNGVEVV